MTDPDRLVLTNGNLTCTFLRTEHGWTPDWFRESETPLLRFKDHEWLSLGRVVYVTHAASMERTEDGAVFSGCEDVLGCPVTWRVTVNPASDGYFRVRTEILPSESIELVEALTSFETPYDYDGTEHSMTLIGGNPATVWKGDQRMTPPVWDNPDWCYSREEAARQTYDCHHPVLVHHAEAADGSKPVYVSVCANFDVCDFHDLYTTPTRTIRKDVRDYGDLKRGTERGYKIIVGAVNWASSYVKDPNILVTPAGVRQELDIACAISMPSGSIDQWLMNCWEHVCALHNDGSRLPVSGVYQQAGADWKEAGAWLQKSMIHPGSTGMATEAMGPVDYLLGTRPISNYCYGHGWRHYLNNARQMPLLTLRYRTLVQEQPEEAAAVDALERHLIAKGMLDLRDKNSNLKQDRPLIITGVHDTTPESPIGKLYSPEIRPDADEMLEPIEMNEDASLGNLAGAYCRASTLMTAETFEAQWRDRLQRLAEQIETHFWDYGYAGRKKAHISGGQSSPCVFLRAATLYGKAYQLTGDERFARDYARFVNMGIGWGFHTYNGDDAEDFDFRGMTHACMSGRDQRADVPPMENTDLMMALGWLDIIPEKHHRKGWFDCAWLSSQTSLCQYPAARTTKRLWTPHYGRAICPLEEIATERRIREQVPYMAYENPYDQTLIATYQSFQGLTSDMFWGGLLADAGPDVLCMVPRTGRMDSAERTERKVCIYNPSSNPKTVTPSIVFGSTTKKLHPQTLEPHAHCWLTINRGA